MDIGYHTKVAVPVTPPLTPEGISLLVRMEPGYKEILTPEALDFIISIHRKFNAQRKELLKARAARQKEFDQGCLPDFLPETKAIRQDNWKAAPTPKDIRKRTVEITGPVDRKMIINALNSDVDVFMADFEDSCAPTWENVIQGQINLRDAVRRTIDFTSPAGKHYRLNNDPAVLFVRPRGLHLEDTHILIDGHNIAGSFLDFGLYFFHNVNALINMGTGPYFYLPKLESHTEAELWNDVFVHAQNELNIPIGTIKATVLIETITAAFEMDEILYALRDHTAGLNCGRWDYIFSFIKKFRNHSNYTLPDRAAVTMERHFLKSYVDLLVYTCHKRGVHAMGGMAAQIPIKNDPEANNDALERVRQDKIREAAAGHDGTWIAHPGLANIAQSAFAEAMDGASQIDRPLKNPNISAQDLLKVPQGMITEAGLRHNIRVGIHYLEAWLRGSGCVPLYHLMEDTATAEICRSQLWQWVRHGAEMETGTAITPEYISKTIQEEMKFIQDEVGNERFYDGRYQLACRIFSDMVTGSDFEEFLTLPAYQYIS